jgi:hypothetical protein
MKRACDDAAQDLQEKELKAAVLVCITDQGEVCAYVKKGQGSKTYRNPGQVCILQSSTASFVDTSIGPATFLARFVGPVDSTDDRRVPSSSQRGVEHS